MSDLGPFEPAGGQDPEPPALGLAIVATIRLLNDVRGYLEPAGRAGDDKAADLMLRAAAIASVLHRIRRRLKDDPFEEVDE
jgi:hypothetical protein